MSTVTDERPVTTTNDGDHERFAHIVKGRDRVTEATILGTPVEALCGKVWVPSRDPKRFPLCPECREIAERMGANIPSG